MLEALLELPTAILRPPSMLPPVATEKARPSDRFRLLLAVITGLCTAAALAYALLY
jgi:hypothetical protein